MFSPEVQSRIAILQAKALDGTMTLEDQKEAILLVRKDRTAATTGAAAKRKAAKAAIPDADTFLENLLKQ